MAEGEHQPKRRRRRTRLIVRLGALLVSHSILVSVLCCVAGTVALLLLPVMAKTTYISENALMPGSANPMLSGQDVSEANRFIKDLLGKDTAEKGLQKNTQRFLRILKHHRDIKYLIGQRMADVGAEVYYHRFQPLKNQFQPLHFFSSNPNTGTSQKNGNCTSFGVNFVGTIRAPRGDGKEAIVLVTPYNSENLKVNDALSLGLGFSVFSLLSRVAWLAKDIVWLAADSRYGEYSSVATWLKDYHNPVFFGDSGEVDVDMCAESNIPHEGGASMPHERGVNMYNRRQFDVFRRAGTMAAAIVFKVVGQKQDNVKDSLTIHAEASNGQMPNLDLINIVHYLAVHRQGLQVKVGIIGSLLRSVWVKLIGETMQTIGKLAKRLNPKWKFEISAADYVEGAATLASSMYYQALGVPTGPHGAFRDYQVDAITLELSPKGYINDENVQTAFLLRTGRLIEGVVRSVNNLLEKFHQSFFLYFLTGPNKFVSVGVYMIGFALLIAPLPIVAAALSSAKKKQSDSTDSSEQSKTSSSVEDAEMVVGSWKWLHAAKVVFMTHLWAVIVALIPYLISQCSHITAKDSILSWVGLSVCMLLILYLVLRSPYSYLRDGEWKDLKAMMVAAACIGLGLMSIINFATAQIGAMLLVPMCLIVQPLKRQMLVSMSLRAILVICNLALVAIGFPPTALFVMMGLAEGFGRVDIGIFWEWAEFLWAWNSATYLYLVLVHLPCWVLCLHILLHP